MPSVPQIGGKENPLKLGKIVYFEMFQTLGSPMALELGVRL